MKKLWLIIPAFIFLSSWAEAKVDLVTLPKRDRVQLTIYNSADLTLVRENRALTLRDGHNALQFSWVNTLIDPTSLEMMPLKDSGKLDVSELNYPPRVRNLGIWNIESQVSGRVPVEINYLTSGLSWRAFYLGTLSKDERTMDLQGFVRVTNNSGEDYDNARIRLIVGKIHLLDRIAKLAGRKFPYGRPGIQPAPLPGARLEDAMKAKRIMAGAEMMSRVQEGEIGLKEIKKEGLSEYYLYTIEGTETIPNGWSKRLPSFESLKVPVLNLYKYEEEKYGRQTLRFLSFKNDTRHHLGKNPIPGGELQVYRNLDEARHLSYEGRSNFKYIPVDQDVELNLGVVRDVIVEPTLMDYRTADYLFSQKGDISGWNEVRRYRVTVKNRRKTPAKVEVRRNFTTPHWELKYRGSEALYEKVDIQSVKFSLELQGDSEKNFEYVLTMHHGRRAE